MDNRDNFLGQGFAMNSAEASSLFAPLEGADLVEQSIRLILSTTRGERIMRPDFGCSIHEVVFEPNSKETASQITFYVKDALDKYEPRIEVQEVTVEANQTQRNYLDIHIAYTIKTTNSSRNLVYPFYLEGNK